MAEATFGSQQEHDAWLSSIEGRIKANSARQKASRARLKALETGDPAALTGGATTEATKLRERIARGKASAAAPSEAALKAAEDAKTAIEALAALDEKAAAAARNELQTKIHAIREEAKERRRLIALMIEGEKVREGGPRPGRIDELRARADAAADAGELGVEGAKAAAALAAMKKTAEVEKAARDERLTAERTLAQDVARLRIEASLKGHEKTMALIDLEEKQALQAARAAGVSEALVKSKFDLRRQIAEAGQDVGDSRTLSNRGMFRTGGRLGAFAGGGYAERQTKAAEKAAERIDDLVAMAENGDLALATV
jgi:hypothetical protein